jgi:hypothetical protein
MQNVSESLVLSVERKRLLKSLDAVRALRAQHSNLKERSAQNQQLLNDIRSSRESRADMMLKTASLIHSLELKQMVGQGADTDKHLKSVRDLHKSMMKDEADSRKHEADLLKAERQFQLTRHEGDECNREEEAIQELLGRLEVTSE